MSSTISVHQRKNTKVAGLVRCKNEEQYIWSHFSLLRSMHFLVGASIPLYLKCNNAICENKTANHLQIKTTDLQLTD